MQLLPRTLSDGAWEPSDPVRPKTLKLSPKARYADEQIIAALRQYAQTIRALALTIAPPSFLASLPLSNPCQS